MKLDLSDASLRGNKGEWSEIYALLKLLGDEQVSPGDQNLKKIGNLVYPIVKILREEKEGIFTYTPVQKAIVIQTPDGTETAPIPSSEFLEKAETLLRLINQNDGTFALPYIEAFLKDFSCHTLKAKSSDKTDIRIVLQDLRTSSDTQMGYSIKSQLGGDSTLLNASQSTNFIFKITKVVLTDAEIDEINSINPRKNKVIERYKAILNKGGRLVFEKPDNKIFNNNLILLDRDLPAIIGALLLEQLNSGVSSLSELTQRLTQKNPLNYDMSPPAPPYYEYKIKHLLASVALGMMPATAWSGRYDANGGYLIIKKDGEILTYNFYDKNRFDDYLYFNTYLERASTDRHKYAAIFKEPDGSLFFKLNLQIRFK